MKPVSVLPAATVCLRKSHSRDIILPDTTLRTLMVSILRAITKLALEIIDSLSLLSQRRYERSNGQMSAHTYIILLSIIPGSVDISLTVAYIVSADFDVPYVPARKPRVSFSPRRKKWKRSL